MAIKMRNNTNKDAVCCECNETQDEVLNMFDLCISDLVFTICDACNEKILHKCISAECMKNGRIKTPADIRIINRRKARIRKTSQGGSFK